MLSRLSDQLGVCLLCVDEKRKIFANLSSRPSPFRREVLRRQCPRVIRDVCPRRVLRFRDLFGVKSARKKSIYRQLCSWPKTRCVRVFVRVPCCDLQEDRVFLKINFEEINSEEKK